MMAMNFWRGVGLSALLCMVAATGVEASEPNLEQAKSLARARMVEVLRDPDSARFRNVRYSVQSDGRIIFCGEVNARNGLGGYTGYMLFVTSVTRDLSVNVEIASARNASSRMVVASVWPIVCQGDGVRPISF